LGLRVLVGIWGIPVILFSIWYGKWVFVALVELIVVLGQYEYYKLAEKKGAQPLGVLGIILGFLIVPGFYFFQGEYILPLLFGSILIIIMTELFRNKPNALLNLATTITGLIYPTALFSFLIFIREASYWLNCPYQDGAKWLLAMLAGTWICDTAAFFIGSKFGRHKLFPRVSPNKTVEGAVAGFISALLTMIVVHQTFFNSASLVHLLVIGAIGSSFGQIGDLAESLLKRDAGIKDSSNILPGHGGFLDRFDTLFVTAPLVYLYMKFFIG
jgi:phosphatidate cytidylyltransferase